MVAAARIWFRDSVGVPIEGCGRWGAATVGLPQWDVPGAGLATWILLLEWAEWDGAIGTLGVDFIMRRWRWDEFLLDVIIEDVVVRWVGS